MSGGTESSNYLRELLKNGELENGFEFLESTISLGMVPDVVTCSDVVWGFIKVGHAGKAWRATDIIEGAGLAPDVKTYNALINALCRDGEVDKALDVLDRMKVSPDVITDNTILDGMYKHGKLEQALNFRGNIKVAPDVITYNVTLNILCKLGKLEQALNVVDHMKVEPNVVMVGEVKKAIYLFHQLEGSGETPLTGIYNSVISGLCKSQMADCTIDVLAYMVSRGCKPDRFAYVILVNAISSEGFTKEAKELRYHLRAKGVLESTSAQPVA